MAPGHVDFQNAFVLIEHSRRSSCILLFLMHIYIAKFFFLFHESTEATVFAQDLVHHEQLKSNHVYVALG